MPVELTFTPFEKSLVDWLLIPDQGGWELAFFPCLLDGKEVKVLCAYTLEDGQETIYPVARLLSETELFALTSPDGTATVLRKELK